MYRVNLERVTVANKYYRKVLNTTQHQQLVLMSLLPLEEIGMEIHPDTTQFIRIEHGHALAVIGGKRFYLKDGDAVVIPSQKWHNIINTSKE